MNASAPRKYGTVAKTFHWVMAALVLGMLGVGLVMHDVADLSLKLKMYNLHKATGMLVLGLVVLRILWRLAARYPAPAESLTAFERAVSRAVHFGLYLWMAAMPLSGWLMSSSAERPVSFFGLYTFPDLVGKDEGRAEALGDVHEVLAWSLMALVALHVAGALKHHFIDKDTVLRRMLPFARVE